MESLKLLISNKYGYNSDISITKEQAERDVQKLLDENVEKYRKSLNHCFMVRYETSKNVYEHQKFKKLDDALKFMDEKSKE